MDIITTDLMIRINNTGSTSNPRRKHWYVTEILLNGHKIISKQTKDHSIYFFYIDEALKKAWKNGVCVNNQSRLKFAKIQTTISSDDYLNI